MILPILIHPHPTLKKKAKKIEDVENPEIKELVLDMLETLKNAKGLGLAAPQVGASVRLCVIRLDGKTHILINPEFKSRSLRKETLEEGCLSFPGRYIPIKRHKKVKIKAVDWKGNEILLSAEGMLSRAIQHEMDHLDGILIVDKIKKPKKLWTKTR